MPGTMEMSGRHGAPDRDLGAGVRGDELPTGWAATSLPRPITTRS
ncbi:hypothetical protein [Actinacidiphila oryziradicis]|nr:hypothetical protein [Actinacidiphila oryziradicis]